MDAKELKEIVERHGHWLHEDCDGWEGMRAYLSWADLRGAALCMHMAEELARLAYMETEAKA